MKTAALGAIPETWTCVVLFGFALQSTVCLCRENPWDCGDQTPCTKGEPTQSQCPQGGLCPGPPPTPCPPGTFLSEAGPHNAPFCHFCPAGFFNPWPGQNACFPCGSEATQPEVGKDTCICQGSRRVFQPSDGQCPCLPGYQDVGETRSCSEKEYKRCKDGATWNQEGLCLTKDEWDYHCAHEVCATPEDAYGYDPGLGLCLCWGQHSRGTCGPLCPEEQKHILQLSCSEGIPQVSITGDTGSQEFYILDRPSSPRAVGHPCNLDLGQKSVPLYVVRMDGTGFQGLTKPGRELLNSLRLPLRSLRHPGQEAGTSWERQLTSPWLQSLNSTHFDDPSLPELGIQNPTVCLQTNDTLAFLVTREHYPEYDLEHFYNTQEEFDWGGFRILAEESQRRDPSPYLFLQQFQQPGVYVFRLNSNQHRKMYVRILPLGCRCFVEGPFASTTPRYLIQTGIAKIPKALQSSDWPGVLGEMALLLGLCLLLLVHCHSLSWARKTAPYPTFRKHQQGYNLDAYVSPRTRTTLMRRGPPNSDADTPRAEGGHGGSWETHEQVDLEWFDTESFFGILLRQSLLVTTKLSQTKDELKLLCLELGRAACSVRQLWTAGHRVPASTGLQLGSAQQEQQQAAEAAASAAEEEARRRRRLAGDYAASLRHQLKLLRQDIPARQEQWASFCSALMAARKLLKTQTSCRPMKSSQAGQYPDGEVPQLDAVLSYLDQVVLQESHCLKAWGILGTGTGAELLQPCDPSSTSARAPQENRPCIQVSASPQEGTEGITVDPVTKLMIPAANCTMLLATGHIDSIPSGYFIHPNTGRVLPQAGNLGYDLQRATLVPTVDFSAGGVRTSEAAILPYVPYPTCPATGSPPATHLPILQPRRTSQFGALMTDPKTGIEVPVLAVTLHPQTRQWLTLGGTYCNPLTKTLAPLELGGPMEDPITGSVSPILGVGLDENTGNVLALGGLRDASGNLLLPGDSCVEPLSKKTVRIQGACQQQGQTVPHSGGPQALLDANVLVAQRKVTAVLQQCQEMPSSRIQGLLEAAIKDMRQALALSLYHILLQVRRLERQLEVAEGIEASGGKIGTICYPGTELWIPVLYGMEIPDPEGSGLLVPILGMESDGYSTDATPLAGSMEDANGKGLVPISIGAQAIDRLTGEPGPVIGAQTDPSVGVVVPIVQVLGALPRQMRDPGLLDTLERELRTREKYWHCQEKAEEQLVEELEGLCQELLGTPGKDVRQQLRALKEACAALESCSLQETERRTMALSTQRNPERSMLSQADREEWEQEAQVALGMWKVLQSLVHAAEKLRQAVDQLHCQEKEAQLQQSQTQSLQYWNRARKVVQNLSNELQALVKERKSFLDKALGHLQYQRELSRLQLLHTQIVVSGIPICLENYPGDRFYGTVTSSLKAQASSCPLLIPFLKNLTTALTETQYQSLKLEHQRLATETDKADIMYSALFSSLKKLNTWSEAHKEETKLQGPVPFSSLQDVSKPQKMQTEELMTIQSKDLSAREFVVYQYGLSVLHLLIPKLQAPDITLQIASHLPAMDVSNNVFQGSFFYQSAEKTLFVERGCLASVGNFILLLIHCLAHITTKGLHEDSSPTYLRLFYKGLEAYFWNAFSLTLQMSAASWDTKLDNNLSAILLEKQPISEKGRDLLSKLIESKCVSHLEPKSSEELLEKNKDLLLFTNMEHVLKSIITAEQYVPGKPRDKLGENTTRFPYH